MRIAWIGAGPVEGGGVGGVANLLVSGLLKRGHEIDCYLSGPPELVPVDVQADLNFRSFTAGGWWKWNRWYSRSQMTALVSGLGARAIAQVTLSYRLRDQHRCKPYDVIYQFSNIEMFGNQRYLRELPPVVVHPETHLAGELRWFRQEISLRRQCEPAWQSALIGTMLRVRARAQCRHIKHPALIICISESFRTLLVEDYGLDRERTVVVPNPVDLGRFTAELRDGHRPHTLVFVGRISARKGVDQLVTLSDRLADLSGIVEMKIIGGHTLSSDYRPLLKSLDPQLVKVVGPVPSDEVRQHIAEAAILVQPSMYEPFGLTVAEALASGTPVVVTDAVGAGDFVSGPAVSVVAAGDEDALESAVRVMLDRVEQQGSGLREAARKAAEAAFDPSSVVLQIEDALEKVCGEGPNFR